ncbi:MAG TPA: hypothetical protein VMM55_10520 [Thermohalobaculum sp.]|nr:hypothetical protein [Thermohalobaculum sp.]
MTGPDRRAEKRAWARKHARALFVFFAAFLLGGLLLANLLAVVAGVAGLAWVALARWRA